MSVPACSVIIPSYNRKASLEMVLQGLAQQTLPGAMFETIVVLDGSTDDSSTMLTRWKQSGRLADLHWQWQPNSGQASARNTGVRIAQAPVVVFLDDDVVPDPELLALHLNWHKQLAPLAVLGDYQVAHDQCDSLHLLGVWAWWEDLFYRRALPEHQFNYRDFCSGNVSLRREDLTRLGGFDTAFRGYGGEDYELGYRLLQAGVRFVVDRSAKARHYHRTNLAGVLHATRQEAHGDFLLGGKHPELRSGLRLMWMPTGRHRQLVRLAMCAPEMGDRLMAIVQRILPIYERAQMRRRWLLWFEHLRGYAYWRGVRDVLGSWEALVAYQADSQPLPENRLDIANGLPAVLPPLRMECAVRLTVTWKRRYLGEIDLPGTIESQLRPFLASRIADQLGQQIWIALSQTEVLPWASTTRRSVPRNSVQETAG